MPFHGCAGGFARARCDPSEASVFRAVRSSVRSRRSGSSWVMRVAKRVQNAPPCLRLQNVTFRVFFILFYFYFLLEGRKRSKTALVAVALPGALQFSRNATLYALRLQLQRVAQHGAAACRLSPPCLAPKSSAPFTATPRETLRRARCLRRRWERPRSPPARGGEALLPRRRRGP